MQFFSENHAFYKGIAEDTPQTGRQAADAVTYYGAKTMRFTCRISKLNVGTQSHRI